MYLHGELESRQGRMVSVEIETNGDRTKDVEIGTNESGVWFTAEEPVVTSCDMTDTFSVLLCHSCTIRLLMRQWLPDLFCSDILDGKVNVRVDGEMVFAGYIEPQAYSQPFSDREDQLELSCIDALSALQYRRYKDVGQNGVYYRTVKKEAGMQRFDFLLFNSLQTVAQGLDLSSASGPVVWYDGSKAVVGSTDKWDTLRALSVNDLLFLGEESDDVWGHDAVVEEMLRYLNLHIVQVGMDFYVFDWASVRGSSVTWKSILTTGGTQSKTTESSTSVITSSLAADCGAQISVGEVYNRLELTAEVESVGAVVSSPLDEDSLTNAFSGKQPYLVEYSSTGEGETAYQAFRNMLLGESSDWEYAVERTWFVKVLKNVDWKFAGGGTQDIYNKYARENKNQQDLLNALREKPGAAIISMGKVENKMSEEDNSPTSSVSMETGLYISVNGNGKDTEADYYPNAESILKAVPLCSYEGATSGGVFSPVDDDTVNYIVIGGKMVLNPLMDRTDSVTAVRKAFKGETVTLADCDDEKHYLAYVGTAKLGKPYKGCTVDIEENSAQHGNRYYTQEWQKCETPRSAAVSDTRKWGLCPYTGEVKKQYKFEYSAVGESSDTISKVPVLACMLVIGGKCVVEVGMDGGVKDYEGAGPGSFVWVDYKTREKCADDAEYYAQSFTIGFDPKKNDYLIGTEFSVQNNIDWAMGLDVEGTAIPIRRSDHVSGAVSFQILGVVNLTWGEIVRKHPSFWRHTKWTENNIPLMAHVSSVILKDFSMEVYSDNGLNSDDGNDYVYVSEVDESFVNKKDDLTFKLTSALTTQEALDMGVANQVAISTPTMTDGGDAVTQIVDSVRALTEKAEKLYVDAYWQEWHEPRVELTMKMRNDGGLDYSKLWLEKFTHLALDKTLFVESVGVDLVSDEAELRMKETF